MNFQISLEFGAVTSNNSRTASSSRKIIWERERERYEQEPLGNTWYVPGRNAMAFISYKGHHKP